MEKVIIKLIKLFFTFKFKNYLRKINKLIQKNHMKNITVLDIGAAGGVNNKWNVFGNKIDFILVEPHKKSAEELKQKGIMVIESVLSSTDDEEIKFYNAKKPLCSSFYKPNFNHLNKFSYSERFKIISETSVITKKLDTEIKKFNQPDFIKIDTEGSELDILKGSTETLSKVFGLEVECSFYQLRENQPLFDNVRNYLENMDFVFVDFVSLIKWEKDKFSFFGQPQLTDALFLKKEELIIDKFNNKKLHIEDLMNYFAILIAYERLDILKFVYTEVGISSKYIEEIINVLEIKQNKINKLKEANYLIEHQTL